MNTQQKILAASKLVFGSASEMKAQKPIFPEAWQKAEALSRDLMKSLSPKELAEKVFAAEQALNQKKTKFLSEKNRQSELAKHLILSAVNDKLLLYQLSKNIKLIKNRSIANVSKTDLWLAQRLFFKRDLSRRWPPNRVSRLVWRFIKNKASVLHLLQEQGIYCVYTCDFLKQLATVLKPYTPILELGAGDGTLTLGVERFGQKVHPIDNKSWSSNIHYPDWVEDMSAHDALRKYLPQAVLCSWPPAGNNFEKMIFKMPSVQIYVAIVSQHEYASGDFEAYKDANLFEMKEDAGLSSLLMPMEAQHRVLVFRRKSRER